MRTQIIIPQNLRNEIESARRVTGESLAEYLRKAVVERMQKEYKKKANLKKLAQEVVGSVKRSSWEGIDVIEWQRQIREDRD